MATNNRKIVVVIDTRPLRRTYEAEILPLLNRNAASLGMTFEDLLNIVSYLVPYAHDENTLDVCLDDAVDCLELENYDDFYKCGAMLNGAVALTKNDLTQVGIQYPNANISLDTIKGYSAYFVVEE